MFFSPLVAGLFVFYVYSFFVNIYYSFTDKGSFGDPKWMGLKNYAKLLGTARFYGAVQNTLSYVAICVPFVVVLAILMAALLNSKIRGTGAYRTMIFLPAVTMPAAIGLLWKWVFNYEFGILNAPSVARIPAVACVGPRRGVISVSSCDPGRTSPPA